VYGVYVGVFSSNNTLTENTLNDNLNGIYLDDFSESTTMRDNYISGGQMNFGVSPDIGHYVSDGSDLINDIDISNTVNGKPIVYWMNQHNQQVPASAGYVMLVNSTNILIQDLNLSNNVQNIFLLTSNNTIIENNSIANSIYGIDIGWFGWLDSNTSIYYRFYSCNTTVKGNVLVNNSVGIRVLESDNSTISSNVLHRNPLGILADTSNSIISRNVVVASDIQLPASYPGPDLGIFYYPEWQDERSRELASLEIGGIIVGGDYTVVYGNTVMNSSIGISMDDQIRNIWGYRCIVFHNNLINNTRQALPAPRAPNYWNSSYPSGGNYWSNYNGTDFLSGPYRNETISDGIGDQAFEVFLSYPWVAIDYCPLMGPISIFDAGVWNEVNLEIGVISNSTISDFQLDRTDKTLGFNVTGETDLGFCRVSITNVILQEFWGSNYSVLVNGQPTESRNWSDIENTYIYFIYNHSTQEVTIISESTSLLVLPLFFTATLIAVTIYRRKHPQNYRLERERGL
jgi:parallel beta-helix repeat protein